MIWAREMIDHLKSWFVRHLAAPLEIVWNILILHTEQKVKEASWEEKKFNACLILGEEVQFLCFIKKIISHYFFLLLCTILERPR